MKKIFALIMVLVIMLCFAGCGEQELYDEANALLEAENYEEALAKFQELGDYEDSAVKCEEAEKGIKYNEALALLDAGDNEKAEEAFKELGNYKDSATKYEELSKENDYQKAIKYLNEGEYEISFRFLKNLKGYKDVDEYLSHYQKIEITPENWDKYFEIIPFPEFLENDFGEYDLNGINFYFNLREEYYPVFCKADDYKVIFEAQYSLGNETVSVNSLNGSYEIINMTPGEGWWDKEVITFDVDSKVPELPDGILTFGPHSNNLFFMGSVSPNEDNTYYVLIPGNIEALRVEGSITLYKE